MGLKSKYDGLILLGPFGSGKTYLGYRLNDLGIASYIEMEPTIYALFGQHDEFDVEDATNYLRQSYLEQLSSPGLVAFESTGLVQRPLLLELINQFEIALVCLATPKDICLERVAHRNQHAPRPIEAHIASDFYDKWHAEVAPNYNFDLALDDQSANEAVQKIKRLILP